jgi:hypothetical protein
VPGGEATEVIFASLRPGVSEGKYGPYVLAN